MYGVGVAHEWEVRGDALRREGKYREAVEAYRAGLRNGFQWLPAKACEQMREKIWAAHLDHFEAAPHDAAPIEDAIEWTAAYLWQHGDGEAAERMMERAVAQRACGAASGSCGGFLTRLAERWQANGRAADAAKLREWAERLQAARLR